ncbi:unnamed protein product [Spodoptera exigua]|nr:unnamed protein product [Spodoptera exigua]
MKAALEQITILKSLQLERELSRFCQRLSRLYQGWPDRLPDGKLSAPPMDIRNNGGVTSASLTLLGLGIWRFWEFERIDREGGYSPYWTAVTARLARWLANWRNVSRGFDSHTKQLFGDPQIVVPGLGVMCM